jgi:hypothetical protein
MDATASPSELSAPSSFLAVRGGGSAMQHLIAGRSTINAGSGARDPAYPKQLGEDDCDPNERPLSAIGPYSNRNEAALVLSYSAQAPLNVGTAVIALAAPGRPGRA